MSIQLNCEWCNNKIKDVQTFEQVRDAVQKNEMVCKICRKKVAQVDEYLAKWKQRADKKLDEQIRKLKKDFKDSIVKGDPGGGKNIQDVGAEV